MKYNRFVRKTQALVECYKIEDELRGYPHDEDIIQGWNIDEYLNDIYFEKLWEELENDDFNSDLSEEETEASDIEY